MYGNSVAGTALGHAQRHVGRDFGVPGDDGQEEAEEGGVALERVVVLIIVQTIKHTHTHSHARARTARTPLMHTRDPTRRSPYPVHSYLRTVSM